MSSEACPSLEVNVQEVSSSVPSYPVQQTSYNSLQAQYQLSILESRISEISNSGSSSTMIGRGGGWTRSGIWFGVAGSNIETWKTECTVQRLLGSHRVTEWVTGSTRILYSPRNLSDSFLEGHVIEKNWALTYMWLPILNSGARSHWESAETWYWHELWQCAAWVADVAHRGLTKSWVQTDARSCSRLTVRFGW